MGGGIWMQYAVISAGPRQDVKEAKTEALEVLPGTSEARGRHNQPPPAMRTPDPRANKSVFLDFCCCFLLLEVAAAVAWTMTMASCAIIQAKSGDIGSF
jgi:hypothetical protein